MLTLDIKCVAVHSTQASELVKQRGHVVWSPRWHALKTATRVITAVVGFSGATKGEMCPGAHERIYGMYISLIGGGVSYRLGRQK